MKTRLPRLVDPVRIGIGLLAWCFLAIPTRGQGQEAQPQKAETSGSRPSQDEAQKVEWRTDRAAALQEAKKAGKPILYYFRCDP